MVEISWTSLAHTVETTLNNPLAHSGMGQTEPLRLLISSQLRRWDINQKDGQTRPGH